MAEYRSLFSFCEAFCGRKKNAQGDITQILDTDGSIVVKYVYDAWGNHVCISADGTKIYDSVDGVTVGYESHAGVLNPFRYRSYFYDVETGLYFLQSRYYDPQIGRFISQDDVSYLDPESINGLNLYAYCLNNPVMRIDPLGNKWYDVLAWIGLGLVVAALTVVTLGVFGIAVGGIAGGIIMGAAIGTLALGAVGAVGGAVGGMIYDAVKGNDFGTSIWAGAKAGFGIGAIAGAIIGGAIGFAAGSSISGLSNASVWTGLGKNGASIAGKAATENGLTTLGQTFGGKVIATISKVVPRAISNKMWVWGSKLMVSTVNMTSISMFSGITVSLASVFAVHELPILIKRGIEIIWTIFGG